MNYLSKITHLLAMSSYIVLIFQKTDRYQSYLMLKSLEKTVPRYITNDASSPVIVGKCSVGDKKAGSSQTLPFYFQRIYFFSQIPNCLNRPEIN